MTYLIIEQFIRNWLRTESDFWSRCMVEGTMSKVDVLWFFFKILFFEFFKRVRTGAPGTQKFSFYYSGWLRELADALVRVLVTGIVIIKTMLGFFLRRDSWKLRANNEWQWPSKNPYKPWAGRIYFVQLSWPRINIIPAKLAAMHQCLALLARL